MLTAIHIENFALIDALDLKLQAGLTTITGETGAGKSILLGALGLVLGNRADLSAVRDTTRKCVVETHFNLQNSGLESLFEDLYLDFDPQTIVRREILPSGKSRAFVNDSPVTLNQLNSLGNYLVDIHSQHQTTQLSGDDFQVNVINAYLVEQTKNENRPASTILAEYAAALNAHTKLLKEIDELKKQEATLIKEYEYNTFLLEELEAVQLDKIDLPVLEEESIQLSNVESIALALNEANELLILEESGIIDQLRISQKRLQQVSAYAAHYASLAERTTSVLIELEDLQIDIATQAENIEADPERLETVNNVIATIENLLRKHHLTNVQELISYRDELAGKVLSTQGLSKKLKNLQAQLETVSKELVNLGDEIHKMRVAHAPAFEQEILDTVHALGMPDAQFKLHLEPATTFIATGIESVSFRFTANKGTMLQALDKAASGGELSRLMLAIKSLLSRCMRLPTIIFDEIDTGVSGSIASKMATIMTQMSRSMQVIAITHLPQIAAAGTDHLFVKKKIVDDRTVSQIQLLNSVDRVEELAQMLSGGTVSDAARENARELLK
ncbi:MAG: DNA repair protein RecN [Nonlabens sp.]|nr:DNA repair protein RecN [Nonlabens sp.]